MSYQTIYLAGKIAKNDWRHKIVPQLRHTSLYDEPWVLEHWRTIPTIFPGIVYGGPYFTGCDHGCAHSYGNHGILPEPICGAEAASARHLIPTLCLNAIRNSDIFFAWLGPDNEETRWLTTSDGTDFTPAPFSCYGTMAELGYAAGVSTCKIITAAPHPDMFGGEYITHENSGWSILSRQPLALDELWFAHHIADHNITAPDPVTAVHEAIETFTTPPPRSPFSFEKIAAR